MRPFDMKLGFTKSFQIGAFAAICALIIVGFLTGNSAFVKYGRT